jgi:hypothetical protein
MRNLDKLSAAVLPKTVRVSLPADVVYDLDKFQRVQKDILGRLGCPCTSGFDIRWDVFRNFYVDEKLNIQAGPQF